MQNAYTAAVLCVAACCVAAAFLSGVQVGARAAVANGDAVPLRQLLSSRLRRLQNNGVAPSSEAAGKRYAFVQVLDDQKQLAHPYMASLFATHQRLNETGALEHADHVLMQCGHAPTHPGIKSISFDCSEIDKAVEGQGFHRHCFYKLAPLRLSYARVLILDIDIYVAADPMPVFGYPSPGMVRWENPHSGPFQANSAVVLVQPGEQVYAAALSWLRRIPVMSQQARREKLYNMITPWGAFNNRTAATPPDALQVAAHDGDQQFFLMFFNVLERRRFGPLRELPFEFNVKHYMLKERQWTAKTYLTFMSRPEDGHIRIVHLNRDKPWLGAQCGPYQHAWWHAARRAVDGLSAREAAALSCGGERGLGAFVREGLRHEEARPCVVGARTPSVFVQTHSIAQKEREPGLSKEKVNKGLPKGRQQPPLPRRKGQHWHLRRNGSAG